jgi:hypothetical protein
MFTGGGIVPCGAVLRHRRLSHLPCSFNATQDQSSARTSTLNRSSRRTRETAIVPPQLTSGRSKGRITEAGWAEGRKRRLHVAHARWYGGIQVGADFNSSISGLLNRRLYCHLHELLLFPSVGRSSVLGPNMLARRAHRTQPELNA